MAEGKTNKKSNSVEQIGIRPPHNTEMEKIVLGTILIEPDSIYRATEILSGAESFFEVRHKMIYESILNVLKNSFAIDYLTVSEDLKTQKNYDKDNNGQTKLDLIGGIAYLIELTNNVSTSAHLNYHARIIEQKFIQRRLIEAGIDIRDNSYNEEENIEDLINFAEKTIYEVSDKSLKKDVQHVKTVLEDVQERLTKLREEKKVITGVPTGLEELDFITMGWQKSDLIIIAARPSVGKTSFALSMAKEMACEYNKTIVVFSLEMSQIQIGTRFLALHTGIDSKFFRSGKFDDRFNSYEKVEDAIKKIEEASIYIDDTASISLYEMRSKIRRLDTKLKKEGKPIDCIMIDYLQLMTTGDKNFKGNRELEIGTISRSLKAMAKDFNIPIIALAQLNRSVETRTGDPTPQLSDLRESGSIEQDADIVIFIDRPEKRYGAEAFINKNGFPKSSKKEKEELSQQSVNNELVYVPAENLAKINIAKHRNGDTANVWLKFEPWLTKFGNLDINHPFRKDAAKNRSNEEFYYNAKENITKENNIRESKANDDLYNKISESDNSYVNKNPFSLD